MQTDSALTLIVVFYPTYLCVKQDLASNTCVHITCIALLALPDDIMQSGVGSGGSINKAEDSLVISHGSHVISELYTCCRLLQSYCKLLGCKVLNVCRQGGCCPIRCLPTTFCNGFAEA